MCGWLTVGEGATKIAKREIFGEIGPRTGMAQEPNSMEQVVSRALRDNLERIQRSSDELHQAIADLVAACSSTRPANTIPPLLRAQTSAASLGAALEVLSRFVSATLQPASRAPFEAEIAPLTKAVAVEAPEPVRPVPAIPQPMAGAPVHAPAIPEPPAVPIPGAEFAAEAAIADAGMAGEFDVNQLSTEEQELHRRANRVAKVSMQDIKMLRPEQVRLGRENRDICSRLKDDIEKAHREYDRRFKPIMDHPVDYFYRWLVEILGDGDPHTLGEYPYATTARHH